MYGTVARLQIKPGALDALREMSDVDTRPEGAIAEYIYQMDDDPNELFMVVLFEDKESYHANAQSEEQHERFMQMQQWLTAEPEWHDGEVVHIWPEKE